MYEFIRFLDNWLRGYSPVQATLLLLSGFFLAIGLSALSRVYWKSFLNLNGPAADDFAHGSLATLGETETGTVPEVWFEKYGSTLLFRSSFSRPGIMSRDPNVIRTVLHGANFDGGEIHRRAIGQTGAMHSLAALLGDDHRRVRKAFVPAFGWQAMRQYWPDMLDRTDALLKKIQKECEAKGGPLEIPAQKYCRMLTIETLGRAGFGTQFEAIETERPGNLEKAVSILSQRGTRMSLIDMLDLATGNRLGHYIAITWRQKKQAQAKILINKDAEDILKARKAELRAELSLDAKRDEFGDRNMISIMLRANMASDISPSSRVSDEELRDMIPLVLAVGNSTTDNTMSFAMHLLGGHKEVQDRLRKEVQLVASDDASFDEINKLEYLEVVVREVLRLLPAATSTSRDALRKTKIRLAEPVKGRNGRWIETLTIDKGTTVVFPIVNVNSNKAMMRDPEVFRPERHLGSEMDWGKELNATWGSGLTFGGGERGCPGFRLAISQNKAFLFLLLRRFEVVSPEGLIVKRNGQIIGNKTECFLNGRKLETPDIPVTLKPIRGM